MIKSNSNLYVSEIEDNVGIGLRATITMQTDPELDGKYIENLEIIKLSLISVRKIAHMFLDSENSQISLKRYNLAEFIKTVSQNIGNYLNRTFNVDIDFEYKAEDCMDLIFDGKVVEKALLDAVHTLISYGGRDNRILLFIKDTAKAVKFCARCSIGKDETQFDSKNELMTKYAGAVVGSIGGTVKSSRRGQFARIEISIPKNLVLSNGYLGEATEYQPYSQKFIEEFFADLLYK